MGVRDCRSTHAARYTSVRLAVAGVLLLLLCSLGWGLGQALASSPSPSPSSSSGKIVLRVGYVGEPDNLNPFVAQVNPSYLIFITNYDYLVGVDAATLAPSKETGLAKDWSVSADGNTWTFTLRDGPTWQDNGQPVTADDVAFMLNYIIKNDMSNFTSYVQGISKVTAVDPHTVEIVTDKPKADMLLALNSFPILPEHIWSKVSPKLAGTTYPNDPPIVGSGAFQCVEYKKSSYVIMEANKSYWRGAPKIDELIFQCYTNEDTMAQDLKAGTLDAATGLLNAQLQMFTNVPTVAAKSIRTNGYDDVVFNCYDPPPGGKSLGNPVLKDWKFRQALQWAVDREKIVSIVYYGNARPADTIITAGYYTDPDWHWSPPADQAYTFDLAKADAALTAAGYPLKDGVRVDKQGTPIKLRLWARESSATSQAIGKMLAGWLRQTGLKIDLETMDNGALMSRIYNTEGDEFAPDFDMAIWGWYNSIDPGQSVSYFCTDQINGWSDCAYSNPEYDRLYTEQLHAIDPVERKAILDQMQQIIYEQSPYLLLTYANDTEGWNTAEWQGWVQSPAGFGTVINQTSVLATYLFVQPKVAETGGGSSGGGTSTTTIVIAAIVAAAIVVVVIVLLLRRRRVRAVEE
jgi:peptide/nickel transport system substrate-binding protein